MNLKTAIVIAIAPLALAGCSRGPSEADVKDAFLANPKLHKTHINDIFCAFPTDLEFMPSTVSARKTENENVWEVTWDNKTSDSTIVNERGFFYVQQTENGRYVLTML